MEHLLSLTHARGKLVRRVLAGLAALGMAAALVPLALDLHGSRSQLNVHNSRNQLSVRGSPAYSDTPRTVTYCSPDGAGQRMDIYTPAGHGAEGVPYPVVEVVHGGGWTSGSRGLYESIQPVPEVPMVIRALLSKGFMVTSIDYRLAPAHRFPASVEDVKCSLRFLRAHASQYYLDPNHIGLLGASAGGHLVSLAGLAGESAGWDVGSYLGYSSTVQAVVDMFGPEYLDCGCGNAAIGDATIFGSGPGVLRRASPPTYISPIPGADPPFLIVQGDRDQTVPPQHSMRLYQQLLAAGQSASLCIVHNAGHQFIPKPTGASIEPSSSTISALIVQFLVQHLAAEQVASVQHGIYPTCPVESAGQAQ